MLEINLSSGKVGVSVSYFIEELSNEEFITYSNLSLSAGVTQGTLINEGAGWLRFDYEGKELIISKMMIRSHINWNHLNSANVIFGNRIINILNRNYRVRLLKGADTDPSVNATGNYIEGSHNSEWSRLFYPLVRDDVNLPLEVRNPNAPYTAADLGLKGSTHNWCQEVHGSVSSLRRVSRGSGGVTNLSYPSRDIDVVKYGQFYFWRPCLELIP